MVVGLTNKASFARLSIVSNYVKPSTASGSPPFSRKDICSYLVVNSIIFRKCSPRQTVICRQKGLSTYKKDTRKKQVPSSNGQRQPIIFALRARFLGRFRIRPVAQSLSLLDRSVNWQLSILPGRLHPSTFDVQVLNYCVRNGNRWNHLAIVTRYFVEMFSQN